MNEIQRTGIDNKEQEVPALLYKYMTCDSNDFWKDTLDKKHLYLANPMQFNDPFEGGLIDYFPRVTGISIHVANGKLHPIVTDAIRRYRITCLSESPRLKSMWAHYAGNYSGFCIEFKSQFLNSSIRKVKYIENRDRFQPEYIEDLDYLNEVMEESLTYKSTDWDKEKEWRIIHFINSNQNYSKDELDSIETITSKNYFYKFTNENVNSIILGPKISHENLMFMRKYAEDNKILLKHAYLMPLQARIAFYLDGNEPQWAGENVEKYLIQNM